MTDSRPGVSEHILVGATLPVIVRLIAANHRGIDAWGKVSFALAASLIFSPLRALERILVDSRVRRRRLSEPPVFILGHWRSGTTHLHNLMAQDPAFGYVSTLQGLFPEMCVVGSGLARFLLGLGGPRTRPMDNMEFSPELPWEEEPAIGNRSVHSGLPAWYFPERYREYFDRYVTFETATDAEVQGWEDAMQFTLQKATHLCDGRRIVAKNPWSTARLPQLLKLYPGAKFVHIVRNPYEVFFSSLHGFRTGVKLLAFRQIPDAQAVEIILETYRQLMTRYFEQSALVPEGNLVEVRHEQIKADPLGTIERIYDALELPSFERAEGPIRKYAESLRSYRQNRYEYPVDLLDRVEREWAFAIDRWGYERPGE